MTETTHYDDAEDPSIIVRERTELTTDDDGKITTRVVAEAERLQEDDNGGLRWTRSGFGVVQED